MNAVRRRVVLGLAALVLAGCAATPIPVPANAPRTGAAQPKLVVQEVGDYQCSFCARAEPDVKRLLRDYGDRIALVWRDYPLAMHPDAELAAEAAHEVRSELGDAAFWQYHDALFDGRVTLDEDGLVQFAKTLGADEARMRRALESHVHRAEIELDKRAIDALQIPGFGTPTFIVKDHAYVGALSYAELRAVVDDAL